MSGSSIPIAKITIGARESSRGTNDNSLDLRRYEQGRWRRRTPSAIKIGEKGKEKELEINVRILRSGERGLLYFDPISRRFGLLPWDSIKQIDWAINSMFLR